MLLKLLDMAFLAKVGVEGSNPFARSNFLLVTDETKARRSGLFAFGRAVEVARSAGRV